MGEVEGERLSLPRINEAFWPNPSGTPRHSADSLMNVKHEFRRELENVKGRRASWKET